MTFKVIQGGSKSPNEIKKEVSNKAEQLKIFVSHMRTLESSISGVRSIASKVGWTELDARLIVCHKTIVDTLSFVKNSTKAKMIQSEELKKPPKTNHLKVIKTD